MIGGFKSRETNLMGERETVHRILCPSACNFSGALISMRVRSSSEVTSVATNRTQQYLSSHQLALIWTVEVNLPSTTYLEKATTYPSLS